MKWWARQGSNLRTIGYEPAALTAGAAVPLPVGIEQSAHNRSVAVGTGYSPRKLWNHERSRCRHRSSSYLPLWPIPASSAGAIYWSGLFNGLPVGFRGINAVR